MEKDFPLMKNKDCKFSSQEPSKKGLIIIFEEKHTSIPDFFAIFMNVSNNKHGPHHDIIVSRIISGSNTLVN